MSSSSVGVGTVKPYYVYLMKGAPQTATTRARNAAPSADGRARRTRSGGAANGSGARQRIYAHIGKSRTPAKKVQRHIRHLVRATDGRKYLARVGKNWRLHDWCGPFRTRESASVFQRQWYEQLRRRLPPPPPPQNTYYYSVYAPLSEARRAVLRRLQEEQEK